MAQGLNRKRSWVLLQEIKDRLRTLTGRGWLMPRAMEDARRIEAELLTAYRAKGLDPYDRHTNHDVGGSADEPGAL